MPQRPVHFWPTEDFLTFISYHLKVVISQDSNDLCDLGLRWLYDRKLLIWIHDENFAIHSPTEVGNLKALAFHIGVAIIHVDFICVHAMEN